MTTDPSLKTETHGCDERTIPALRHWAVEQLTKVLPATPASADVVSDAQLVVSELVTNGVRAGCHEMALALAVHPDELVIEVIEDAPGRPQRKRLGPGDDHGRGLVLVEALSRSWGVRELSGRKAVWAVLARSQPAGRRGGALCRSARSASSQPETIS